MTVSIKGEIYLNTVEACDYLNVSRETLNTFPRRYGLKKYKKGVANLYKEVDLKLIKDDRDTIKESE